MIAHLTALLLQAASPSSPPPSPSTADDYLNRGAWYVFALRERDVCVATASYTRDGTELAIHYQPRRNSLSVIIGDDRFQSLKDDQKIELNLYFLKKGKLDSGWGTVSATGGHDTQNKPEFSFTLNARDALTDIAVSETLALSKGDDVIESLDLKGSGEVVSALRRCGADTVKRHPIDPFEE